MFPMLVCFKARGLPISDETLGWQPVHQMLIGVLFTAITHNWSCDGNASAESATPCSNSVWESDGQGIGYRCCWVAKAKGTCGLGLQLGKYTFFSHHDPCLCGLSRPQITVQRVSWCDKVTNHGSTHILHMEDLESLELSGCKRLSNSGWKLLSLKHRKIIKCFKSILILHLTFFQDWQLHQSTCIVWTLPGATQSMKRLVHSTPVTL